MTTQAIVCGACAAEVPHGRLSCPSCGELLASVVGGRRGSHNGTSSTATPETVYAVIAAGRPATEDDTDDRADAVLDDDADETADLTGPDPDEAATDPSAESPAASATAAATWAVAGHAPAATAAPPAPPAPTWPSTAPGAYVPPPPAPTPGPAAPARAWGGYQEAQAGRPPARDVTAAASPADGPSTHAATSAADSIRVAEFVGWLSVAGSALSAVGFLLPWSSTVIGSTGAGYFDRWGLGTPGHIVVALGLLVVLALALVRNPIPVWVRVGLPGLGLGSLLVGLVWPYLVGPLGSGPGVLIVVGGALLLGVAGVIAIAADRHPGAERGV
jgi:hypothetical protein